MNERIWVVANYIDNGFHIVLITKDQRKAAELAEQANQRQFDMHIADTHNRWPFDPERAIEYAKSYQSHKVEEYVIGKIYDESDPFNLYSVDGNNIL